jgi:TfoX/Sxy family transcriptional regulator of competence genes
MGIPLAIPELEVHYRLMFEGGFLYAHIIGIGGDNPHWERSRAQAIDDIEKKHCRYYVRGHSPFSKIYLHVAKPDSLDRSTWYLRTSSASALDDSLLWLPSYPNYPKT